MTPDEDALVLGVFVVPAAALPRDERLADRVLGDPKTDTEHIGVRFAHTLFLKGGVTFRQSRYKLRVVGDEPLEDPAGTLVQIWLPWSDAFALLDGDECIPHLPV